MEDNNVEKIDRNAEVAELLAHKNELIERNVMIDGELDLAKSQLKEMEAPKAKEESR